VTFEEKAGLVPIVIQRRDGASFRCELSVPQPLSLGKVVSAAELAAFARS